MTHDDLDPGPPEADEGAGGRRDPEREGDVRRSPTAGIMARLGELADLLREFYVAPYRGTLARAARDEDDLFMLLVFSEMMGLPNPAGYYMLELLPLLYDRFHDWHRRMGMERSPLSHINCC